MRKFLVVLALLFAPVVLAQSRAPNLDAGLYSISSPSGSQIVSVMPLGNGMYNFFSGSGTTTAITLANGMYSFTDSSGALLGTASIIGNSVTFYASPQSYAPTYSAPVYPGIQGLDAPVQPYNVQPPDVAGKMAEMAQLRSIQMQNQLLENQIVQSCYDSGRFWYKPHWYSTAQCRTREDIRTIESKKQAKKKH